MTRPVRFLLIAGAAVLSLAGLLVWSQPALAQQFSFENVGGTLGLGTADLYQTALNIIRWFLGFVTLVALVYLIYGGFLWLTAGGKEEQVEKAKRTILQAAIGLVIILLAWAIVLFVVRTVSNVTNTNQPAQCDPNNPADFCCLNPFDPICKPPPNNTFDITAITTCAARPDYDQNVPLASAVSLTFNTNLKIPSNGSGSDVVKAAVEDVTAEPNLEIKKCAGTCSGSGAACTNNSSCPGVETCTNLCSSFAPDPGLWPNDQYGKVRPADYSGTAPVGAAGQTKAEWVAKRNTLTFYHLSFSPDINHPDNRYFEPNSTYRVIVPMDGANTALQDVIDRMLSNCRRKPGVPLEGEAIIGENCTVDATNNIIYWTFTTGQDGAGPPIDTAATVPTSRYLSGVGTPDRNVPRNAVVGIDFTGAIDPNSISTDNFQIYKFTTPPNVTNGQNGIYDPTPLPAADFAMLINNTGTGALMQLKQTASCNAGQCSAGGRAGLACTTDNSCPQQRLFDAFTWYRVEVKDVRNLCGTAQLTNPYVWVFETNAAVPGVKQVYPGNGFDRACPSTEVFIQYKTSMWRVDSGSTQCDTGLPGTYVTDGAMIPGSGRTLQVVDDWNAANPNNSCTTYAFKPESLNLQPGQLYHLGVNSDLTIDVNGTKLNYGDKPPANDPSQKPWSFTVTTPENCVQPPYITKISPAQGIDGQCVSVIGKYFDPQGNNQQDPGDKLELATVNQDPNGSWSNSTIVTDVKIVNPPNAPLPLDQDHDFKVTVNHPAPIGPLESNLEPWRLNSGSVSQGPCLLSLSRTSGPEGTELSATGKRFGTYVPGQSGVEFTGPPISWAVDGTTWLDNGPPNNASVIGSMTVASGSGLGPGDVQVVDSSGNFSNAIQFEVTPPPPGAGPRVEETTACDPNAGVVPSPNPKKNDQQACINSWPSARFVSDMKVSTLTAGPGGNIALNKCDSTYTVCNPVNMAAIPITPTPRSFTLHPAANLDPDSYYRVVISTNVTTDPPPPDLPVAFAAPYTWRFKTKVGTAECPISKVVIMGCGLTHNIPFQQNLPAVVTDTACNIVNGAGLTYNWTNSEPLVCTLLAGFTGPTNLCTGPVDPDNQRTTTVTAATEGKTSNACRITWDPTFCNTSADCATNKYGEACDNGTPGNPADDSICVNNQCTPTVNRLDPNSGKIGTWPTVRGCWFGSYESGKSKVLFTSDKEGLAPNPAVCGTASATWKNEWIVREVPDVTTADPADDAVTGPVQVVRRDGQTATSAGNFTVNLEDHPKLCKLVPASGYAGTTSVDLGGQDFGLSRDNPAQDNVRWTNIGDGSTADALNPAPWSANAIKATVPAAAVIGPSDVRVLNEDVASNSLPFDVLDPSELAADCPTVPVDLTCSYAANSPCPLPGLACGYENCCVPQPTIVDFIPPQGATNVCRNTLAQVVFDLPLAGNTVSTDTVKYFDGTVAVNGQVSLRNTASGGTVTYKPGLLSQSKPQELQFSTAPSVIRGIDGAQADLTGAPLKFTTGPDICTLDRVVVSPSTHTFFAANQSYFPYWAEAWPKGGTAPLSQIPNVYTWNWNWLIGDPTIADVTNNNPNADISQQTVTSKNKSGSSYAEATAQVTFNALKAGDTTKRSGRGGVVVEICDNPWAFTDSAGNCTAGGNCAQSYYFSLSYCRGNGTTNLLPNFGYRAIEGNKPADPTRLKSYFFKETQDTRDAIGLLIFDNPQFLSPFDWYRERFPLDTGGSSTTVGGYPALKTGTTTYIGVANCGGAAPCTGPMRGIMVVIDYNSNSAQPSTKSIYSKLLNSLAFNINMDGADVASVIRDTKRKQDLAGVALLAENYKTKNGSYPNLAAGSYIIGISTSAWPSWQNTLGNALGRALPEDPDNKFTPACTAPYETATCWDEPDKKFNCPADSHIYLYKSDGTSYSVYGNMEFSGFANANGTNPCSGSSSCACFNYRYP